MPEQALSGANYIHGRLSSLGSERLAASDRIRGGTLETSFFVATDEEVRLAAEAAARAFPTYASHTGAERATFLDAIARNLESLGEAIVARANLETALPVARLKGELARTCNQLRMFGDLLREGSWVDARIDHAVPSRPGGPKPDIRRMLVPIGPVAVFGASNFPLAFSVAGGDTASALAAGCPVVVKAHPGHLGTSELAAQAIAAAVVECGMPVGVFGLLNGGGEVGRSLVLRPEIEAVGFTGSKAVGRALYDLAASREKPIPVFAEMGSVNPLFVLPGAIAARPELGAAYADSLTLGVGQFCTNPGVLVGLDGASYDGFLAAVASRLAEIAPGVMLNEGIAQRYACGLNAWASDVRLTAIHSPAEGCDHAPSALYSVTGDVLLANPEIAEELFGPAAIAVKCSSFDQMVEVARSLTGQLTTTVHYGAGDESALRAMLPVLASIAGRVIANGFPTGVEVCPSMQHGGPYPATTDSRSTSVGTAAILRFVRPVAYQNIPDDLLPEELQESNPLGIRRLVG